MCFYNNIPSSFIANTVLHFMLGRGNLLQLQNTLVLQELLKTAIQCPPILFIRILNLHSLNAYLVNYDMSKQYNIVKVSTSLNFSFEVDLGVL